jgi:hypothetical protein
MRAKERDAVMAALDDTQVLIATGIKSAVVNDLIRKAREIEAIRARLVHAEQSGFTDLGRAEILAEAKEAVRLNGD